MHLHLVSAQHQRGDLAVVGSIDRAPRGSRKARLKQLLAGSVLLCSSCFALSAGTDTLKKINRYNVSWNSPGQDAHGSMPLGNGDVGINTWVEPSGDVVFYVSKTDAWDENGRLCKIGKVRVQLRPALEVTNRFHQVLSLGDGAITIQSGGGSQTKIRLWVDAVQPEVLVDVEAGAPSQCRASVELWRLRERPFGEQDDSHSGGGLSRQAFKPTVLPDVVLNSEMPEIVWYHHNTRSIFPLSLQKQHLESLREKFADPLMNRSFGAILTGEGMVRDGQMALTSSIPARHHRLCVSVLAEQNASPEIWLKDLSRTARAASASSFRKSRHATAAWWREFWNRSWVFVDENASGSIAISPLTRGYLLQRFMNACSGRGGSPIKFNGSIFTVEKTPGASPETPDGDPDWRQWGGNYWFQNTRLAYWPMLAAGDFEMMQPWFRMYLDALPLAKARVKSYYDFESAAVFPETMYFWGLPNNGDYGWSNHAPEPANSYIRRYWNGSLELIAVMLDRYDFTQDQQFARKILLPLADPLIAFLDQYWKRDANGKIRFDPAQSLETWHVAVNPMPEIAGLHFLLPRLLQLPETLTTDAQRRRWSRLLGELPPIPAAEVNGVKLLQPAESFSQKSNSENPELYAVFPYRLFGVGRSDLEMARATFNARANHHNRGWCQDSIQAACLGLGDEASLLVAARAGQINESYRFPAMWGPNFDWIPDQDHGNNILTTLQFMLLQSNGDKIYLLPAWPGNWDVAFKLHATKGTTVECELRKGKMVAFKVTPKSRTADVINMLER